MSWTCEQTEARLSDYLDGLLSPSDTRAFNVHVNACERCTQLVSGVGHLLGNLYAMEAVEPPPRLVYNILDKTLGPREVAKGWRSVFGWLRILGSRRFVYSAVSVAASLLILALSTGFSLRKPRLANLSPVNIYHNANSRAHLMYAQTTKFVSDLRVVYEIQSRLGRENDLPANQENTLPQSPPEKQPGRTERTRPGTPRQQNRAFDIGKQIEVLASEVPAISSQMCAQWIGRRFR